MENRRVLGILDSANGVVESPVLVDGRRSALSVVVESRSSPRAGRRVRRRVESPEKDVVELPDSITQNSELAPDSMEMEMVPDSLPPDSIMQLSEAFPPPLLPFSLTAAAARPGALRRAPTVATPTPPSSGDLDAPAAMPSCRDAEPPRRQAPSRSASPPSSGRISDDRVFVLATVTRSPRRPRRPRLYEPRQRPRPRRPSRSSAPSPSTSPRATTPPSTAEPHRDPDAVLAHLPLRQASTPTTLESTSSDATPHVLDKDFTEHLAQEPTTTLHRSRPPRRASPRSDPCSRDAEQQDSDTDLAPTTTSPAATHHRAPPRRRPSPWPRARRGPHPGSSVVAATSLR
ncbi:serine/arginine repetitive matrix protein 1-like [Sorghum bicolor]|uniref:serine/arginine repetitive matrix protein 1-like n=1 Tax=Sorghum bicolor TaxID=4558 RepID=UPI000B424180|nr:serine/arginine repetitive matrix protein 1-like [Sorghum bicolor]|eukprot:XP_021315243.1 serine/arginine repetitive matrix protein 1-like [Sorghum bicolor]